MTQQGRRKRLESTVTAIQSRWGVQAIRKAREMTSAVPICSTGFPALDGALGIGGLPQGRFTELIGYGTVGQLRVAASTLAQAQRLGQQVVYVDLLAAVDVEVLARCGVCLEALVILRPRDLGHALAMISDLLRLRGAGTVVLDRLQDLFLLADGVASQSLDRALRDWTPWIDRAGCTLLFLTEMASPGRYPEGLPLPAFASVRLLFEWQAWQRRGRKITGFSADVTVLKNKLAPAGQKVRLTFALD